MGSAADILFASLTKLPINKPNEFPAKLTKNVMK
jgi:hypothetical protein